MTDKLGGKPILSYWNTAPKFARPGFLKLMMVDAGVEWQDVFVDNWQEQRQGFIDTGKSPAGCLPVLQIGDRYMAQTPAIGIFLADKLGYGGRGLEEWVTLETIIDVVRDFGSAAARGYHGPADLKEQAMKDFTEKDVPKYYTALEGYLKKFGASPFILKDHPTHADFLVYTILSDTGANDEKLASFPHLKALFKAVEKRERIAKWLPSYKSSGSSHKPHH